MKTIEDVRAFWDEHPLFTGVENVETGSREFFERHTETVLRMNGGAMPPEFLPVCRPDDPILSLGCGVGFWLPWYWERGFRNITAADLSPRSIELARERAALFGVAAKFDIQNAEAMTFPASTFAHVDCTGVIHHSPNPQASINEIYRVLRPGGRAAISVYYINALHRAWPVLRPIVSSLGLMFGGRGREKMLRQSSVNELIRLYDGADNPVGVGFSKADFTAMFANWQNIQVFYCAFPSQMLPFASDSVIRFLMNIFPFMIGVVAEKPR